MPLYEYKTDNNGYNDWNIGEGRKKRPPRLLYDKKKKRYYIVINRKRLYITIKNRIGFENRNVTKGVLKSLQKKLIKKYPDVLPSSGLVSSSHSNFDRYKKELEGQYQQALQKTETDGLQRQIDEKKKELEDAKEHLRKVGAPKDYPVDLENYEETEDTKGLTTPRASVRTIVRNIKETPIKNDQDDQVEGQINVLQNKLNNINQDDNKEEYEKIKNELNELKAKEQKRKDKAKEYRDRKKLEGTLADQAARIARERTKRLADAKKRAAADPDDDKPFVGNGKLPALWSDQIEDFFSGEPKFTGVYARDEIDKIPKKVPQGFVMNMSKRSEPGSHWVAVNITPDSLEYFDPLADRCPDDIRRILQKKLSDWKLPVMLKFKENRIIQQHGNSHHCGYHACRFLQDRFDGLPFPLVSRFKDNAHVEKSNNSSYGEGVIKDEFKLI